MFEIDKTTSLLLDTLYVPSPNCDARPDPSDINLVVVHNISLPPGEFGGPYIEQLFTNRLDSNVHPFFESISGLKVSAHILIRREGTIIQFVPFDKRAWHAGSSIFQNRSCCNDFSIGIELEGADELAYTEQQYNQLAEVISALMKQYPAITLDRITGHSDIAPERKTDPGPAFDWSKLFHVLDARLG